MAAMMRLPLYCAGEAVRAEARSLLTSAAKAAGMALPRDAYATRVATVASLVEVEHFNHEDLEALRAWLGTQRSRLAHTPALVQQRRLVTLEAEVGEPLRALQAECKAEAEALAALPGHSVVAAARAQVERLTYLSAKLSATAVAAAAAAEPKAARVAAAAEEKEEERETAQAELVAVLSPELEAQEARLAAAESRLEELLLQSGVAAARKELAIAKRGQGAAAGSSGRQLEVVACSGLEQHLRARWAASKSPPPPPWHSATTETEGPRVHLLQNVTLAMAGAELDAVVVVAEPAPLKLLEEGKLAGRFSRQLRRSRPTECYRVCEVLAVAEVKSNSNDVLHNIPRLQAALSFLTNEEAEATGPSPPFLHTAAEWTTWLYPRGSFAGTALHLESASTAAPELGLEAAPAKAFIFDAALRPFHRFHRNEKSSLFEEGVVYVTRDSPIGLPSSFTEKLLHRVARTANFDENDDDCITELQRWCEETMGESLRTVKEMADHARRLHDTDALLLSPLFPNGRAVEAESAVEDLTDTRAPATPEGLAADSSKDGAGS